MKHAILFATLVAITNLSFSRPVRIKSGDNFQHIVYTDSNSMNMPAMQLMLTEIMNAVGLLPNFELREAKVLNIEATISHRKRYISYNPDFIKQINTATKNKWAVMLLLAHEVAHHLNGHTIQKSGSKPELELEADEFAGFVLHKLGATLEQSQQVMKYIASKDASITHPSRASRMLAIQTGWNKAANAMEIANAKTQR